MVCWRGKKGSLAISSSSAMSTNKKRNLKSFRKLVKRLFTGREKGFYQPRSGLVRERVKGRRRRRRFRQLAHHPQPTWVELRYPGTLTRYPGPPTMYPLIKPRLL